MALACGLARMAATSASSSPKWPADTGEKPRSTGMKALGGRPVQPATDAMKSPTGIIAAALKE